MKNYWIKSGFYTLLQRLSTLIFGFGGFYLLIRMLSKQEFGAWALVVSVTALLEVARNGLIQNGLIKFSLSENENELPKIQSAALFLNISLTLFSCIFLLVMGPILESLWKAQGTSDILYFYCFTSIALIPFQQFSYILQSTFNFKYLSFMYIIRQGTFFLSILYYFLFNESITLINLSHWLLIGSIFSSFIGFFFTRKHLKINQIPTKYWITKLFNYGKFSFGTNISGMLFNSIDQIMLGALMGTSEVAIYNACFKINNLIEVPISTVSSIVFPQTSLKAGQNKKEDIKKIYEKSVSILLALILPVVLFASMAPEFILFLIAGKSYTTYSGLLILIMSFTIVQPFTRQFGIIMDSIGKPNINFYCILLAAFITLSLNYLLIPLWGLNGAAISTLLAIITSVIINIWVLKQTINIDILSIFKELPNLYKTSFLYVLYKLKNINRKTEQIEIQLSNS